MTSSFVFFNDRIIPCEQAMIPVSDRSFRYGDAVFETMRIRNGVPCLWGVHRGRLARGLDALKIPVPNVNLAHAAQSLIEANGAHEGTLRLHISRGSGSRGYLPNRDIQPLLLIETLPLPIIPESLQLWHSQWRRYLPEEAPTPIKSAQGLVWTLARMEAAQHNCNEALLTNIRGEVCELSSAGLFWGLPDGSLAYPSANTGAMESVMVRAFRAALNDGKAVAAPLESLKDAVGVVATNAAWQCAVPVRTLAPQDWGWNGSDALAARMNARLAEVWDAFQSVHEVGYRNEAAAAAHR